MAWRRPPSATTARAPRGLPSGARVAQEFLASSYSYTVASGVQRRMARPEWPPATKRRPFTTAAPGWCVGAGIGARVSHRSVAGSYTSTVPTASPLAPKPPMTKTRPPSAAAATSWRAVGIGARAVHVPGLLMSSGAAESFDPLARGVARERPERAREDEGLAGQGLRPGGRLRLGGDDAHLLEPFDQGAVSRIVEEGPDRPRDRLADAVHLGQLGFRRLREPLETAEAGGEELRHALAHEPDTEGVQQARQPPRPRPVDGPHQVLGGLVAEALEVGESVDGESVKVGEVFHQPPVDELLDDLLAEVLDVHRAARAAMTQPLLELGRAAAVHAPPVRFALGTEGDAATRGAARGKCEDLGAGGALGGDDLDDVGDHVAGALDEDRVADADVLPTDLVLVVQAHVADHDAGQLHGLELRDGREDAGLADADLDRLDHRGRLTRGELERDRPARVVGGGAEAPLVLERVDLDDDAVGVVAEVVAKVLEPLAVGDHGVERLAALDLRLRLEAGRAERRERLPVGGEGERVGAAQMVEKDVERVPCRDGRVFLAAGARREVPPGGEGRLARLREGAVQLGERRAAHEHLAAHLEHVDRGEGAAQHHRNGADGLEIRRDVLPDAAVATGRAAHEAGTPVEERDAEAVDLRLAHVGEAGPWHRPADPRLELAQIVCGGRVVEGEHCNLMLDRLEDVRRRARDALGRTVAGDQVGEAPLELAQLPHEPVVLGVGDLGTRLDVVQMIVVVDLLAQLHDPSRRSGPGHEGKNSRSRFGSFLAALGYQQLYSTRRADGEVFFPPTAMRSSPPQTRS